MKVLAAAVVAAFCVVAGSVHPALAQNFQWQANAFDDRGPYTAFLTQSVPETDNVAFRARCRSGSSGQSVHTVLVYNVGTLGRNTPLSVSFHIDGRQVHTLSGEVHLPSGEEGMAGIRIRPAINDPLWEILAANTYISYEADGMGKAGMHLSGSRQAVERFLAECRGIFGVRSAPRQQVQQQAPSSGPQGKVRYNCQNGPQMTVVYRRNSLHYVYDGPDSAMRTMRPFRGNQRHFKDGANSITLEPDINTVDYREGDLYDRCRRY